MRASSLRWSTRVTSSAICRGVGSARPSRREKISRTCGTVMAGVFFSKPPLLLTQEPQCQERKRHVVVPADPTANLIMRQADFALGFVKNLFDAMPLAMDTHQHFDVRRAVAQRVPGSRLGLQGADHQQALRAADPAIFVLRLHSNRQSLNTQRPLVTIANLHGLPTFRRLPGGPAVGTLERRLAAIRLKLQLARQGIRRHVHNIALPLPPQPQTKRGYTAKFVVRRDPAMRQMKVARQQLDGDPPLLLKHNFFGHVALLAPYRIVRPFLVQIQTPVQRCVTLARCIGQEHSHLAILKLAEASAPLTIHAARLRSLLREGTTIDNKDAIGITQLLADMAAQFGHDLFVIPQTRADKMLHRLTRSIHPIRDRLGGLSFQVAQLSLNHQRRQFPLLGPIKQRQIALQKLREAFLAASNDRRGNYSVSQQSLGLGCVEQRHPCPSVLDLPWSGKTAVLYPPVKNCHSRTRRYEGPYAGSDTGGRTSFPRIQIRDFAACCIAFALRVEFRRDPRPEWTSGQW